MTPQRVEAISELASDLDRLVTKHEEEREHADPSLQLGDSRG